MLFMTADISVVVARSRGLVLRFATQTPHPERVVETGAGIFSPKLMAFSSSVWEGKCCCYFFPPLVGHFCRLVVGAGGGGASDFILT